MITKEEHLTTNGDCIIAVAADKGPLDLSKDFKEALKKSNAKLNISIETDELVEHIGAVGSPKLILTHPSDVVIRKSHYISDRTLAIGADKASLDLSREFVEKLRNPRQKVKITLTVNC